MSEAQTAATYAAPVPAAVLRAAARSEQLIRDQAAATPPDGAPPPPAPGEAPAPAAPTTVVAAAEPPPAAPPVQAAPAEDWKHRYDTLNGKYSAEVPQLQAQVNGLQNLLATLQAPAARPASAATEPAASVSPADIEAFGPELVEATQRWALAILEPRLRHIESQLGNLGTNQQRVEAQTTQQRVMSALDGDAELGQKWRRLNEDPAFLQWLEGVDSFTGHPRKNLLGDAFNRGDAVRTAAFFRAFTAQHTATTQPAPAATPTLPVQPEPGRPTLDSLAAPGRPTGNPASSGATGEKRIWTKPEISAFYAAKLRGAYNGREAVALATEQDLVTAAAEGRIR